MAFAHERIYTIDDIYALPEGQRAELIDGHLYMMAPPNFRHQKLVMELSAVIHRYIKNHGGDCEVLPAPFAVFLNEDDRNYVEPDISVICDKDKLNDKGCNGAPDWIIEIVSPSTSGHDYVRKLNLYLDAGVREYWIVDPRNRKVLVYHLEQDDVKADSYTFQDKIKVNIYDDLWISLQELGIPGT